MTWWMWLLAGLGYAAGTGVACRRCYWRGFRQGMRTEARFRLDAARFEAADCGWTDEALAELSALPRVPVLNDGWSPPWQPAQFAPGMERVLAAEEAALIGALAGRADGIIESIRRPA